jgi:hypothetical protein
MWWGFLAGLVFVYPVIELVEDWRLRQAAARELTAMRTHVALGHRWDAVRGRWIG